MCVCVCVWGGGVCVCLCVIFKDILYPMLLINVENNSVKGATAMVYNSTATYGLRLILYTGAKLWNDLFSILNDDGKHGVSKSPFKILTTDHLVPTFSPSDKIS